VASSSFGLAATASAIAAEEPVPIDFVATVRPIAQIAGLGLADWPTTVALGLVGFGPVVAVAGCFGTRPGPVLTN